MTGEYHRLRVKTAHRLCTERTYLPNYVKYAEKEEGNLGQFLIHKIFRFAKDRDIGEVDYVVPWLSLCFAEHTRERVRLVIQRARHMSL